MKQRCESEQFNVINDKLEMDARVFISNGRWGKRARQKERECVYVRDGALLEEWDSVGNKIDC